MSINTNALKTFAQSARRQLLAQVGARMEQVLTTDSAALREKLGAVNQLSGEIEKKGRQQVVEEVAYTWFNRLCALRFMDVNKYTRSGLVSPVPGTTQPEILQQAKQGLFDSDWQLDRKRVSGLLDRSISSQDPDQEAYRLLLVAVCNRYAREMEFLFESISDYTELLMPEDLLSKQSVLQAVQQALTPEVCQDVEVIGWLYQFYISEKKDQVMAAKNAVKKEDIPAVTQLFTPDWIVRYMVQNSLGRLWLLNQPISRLRAQMEYYVQPESPETDFLRVSSPEELKLLDPACGSGHILTYAFDLLFAIYEEQGYSPVDIPQLILQKNLYGIEIDRRAAELASFALMMKARGKDKRFLQRGIRPNILEMEDLTFEPGEAKTYLDRVGRDLYTQDLWEGLQQFENAKTFGSLIRPAIKDVPTLRERMQAAGVFGDLFLSKTNEKLLKVLEMSEYLSPRYQVVVANPPYMGGKNLNGDIKTFAEAQYPETKSDLFAMFIERGFELVELDGYNAMVTMQSWMFLSSYEKMRQIILETYTIISMVHMANMVMGIAFGTAATIFKKSNLPDFRGHYSYIDNSDLDETNLPFEFPIKNRRLAFASAQDFKKIPGSPIAYWVSDKIRAVFSDSKILESIAAPRQGMATSDNNRFVRLWHEVPLNKIGLYYKSKIQAHTSGKSWFPYNKGGAYRKWYGNNDHVIIFDQRSYSTLKSLGNHCPSEEYYFKDSITWTFISSNNFGVRYSDVGAVFDVAGSSVFPPQEYSSLILGLMCSKLSTIFMGIMNPTFNFQVGDIKRIPVKSIKLDQNHESDINNIVNYVKSDWDSYETSWGFSVNPLLKTESYPVGFTLSYKYNFSRDEWQAKTVVTQRLEEENNRVFIDAYGLQDELTPEVPLDEITLTCNPHYRYKGSYTDEQREARLLEDTIKEFLSYAVGCTFGRYSLDKPGLVLANQGETLQDYLRIIGKERLFTPTETNVIPILDGDWFADDIVPRFKDFLKVTFGEENYEENLRFIEAALGKDLRKYFLKDFYKDHLQTYKNRPIYWLFSSPKGSFNCLVYMHRYTPDTVSVILNQYLREFREKLSTQRRYLESLSISPASSPREKTDALKNLETLSKTQAELKAYEEDVLFPLAGQRLSIDLDDGVVVNYAKFGPALRKII